MNSLTRKQFDVLTYLECSGRKCTQREISDACGMSVGSVNRVLSGLSEQGFVSDGSVTEAG